MEDQNGQLNKNGNGGGSIGGDGVGSFSAGAVNNDNGVGLGSGVSGGGKSAFGKNGGKSVYNETESVSAEEKVNSGPEKVVSLKGEMTQKELEEQKKLEEMKARAVKLEGKQTKTEKEKAEELERLKARAVKLPADTVDGQTEKHQSEKGKIIEEENVYREKQETAKRQVGGENSVVKKDIEVKSKDKKNIENEGNFDKERFEKQPRKQRMVISPDGKISWEGLSRQKNVVNLKEESGAEAMKSESENISGGKVVNLKEWEGGLRQVEGRVDIEEDGKRGVLKKEITAQKKGPVIEKVAQKASQQKTDVLDLKEREEEWENKRVDLSALSEADRIRLQATPSMASVHWKMDDDLNGEVAEWFKKYDYLPVNIQLGLGDDSVKRAIIDLAGKFGLNNEEGLGEISRIVREVYTDLIGESEIRRRAVEVLKISADKVENFLKGIALVVALVKEVGTKKSEEYFEKLTLEEILEKYPEIAEKNVTSGQITEKGTNKYLQPTVKNWLDDYVSRAGADKHNNLERGKYLTDSPNVRILDKADKKKIEMLTKSYDEGFKLVVDPKTEEILWQLHTDESSLGINTDKEKRVINNFKIDEAQTVDVDNFMGNKTIRKRDVDKSSSLSKVQKDSIIKGDNRNNDNVGGDDKGGVLDLSSEIENRNTN
jgi:surface antigen